MNPCRLPSRAVVLHLVIYRVFNMLRKFWQTIEMTEEGTLAQLLQTTTLLLSKMAESGDDQPQMLAVYNQLPEMDEIVSSLPLLLSTLGHFSLQVNNHV